MIGAVSLSEVAFTVADQPEKFQKVFESLQLALHDTAQINFDEFKVGIEQMRKDPSSLMNAESPLALAVTRNLDLVCAWVSMHDRVLERFET
jgi:hypothetical protein